MAAENVIAESAPDLNVVDEEMYAIILIYMLQGGQATSQLEVDVLTRRHQAIIRRHNYHLGPTNGLRYEHMEDNRTIIELIVMARVAITEATAPTSRRKQ